MSLQKALDWIKTELRENPNVDAARKRVLITKASLNFDLSPLDGEYLENNLKVDSKPAVNPKTD
ncbi:hypothetical protein A2662_00880 [Candidatus Giovannonibacteria bacterium RIFCSPHIGHO2_01_FULL_45_33]|uniref:Uncharacterized protein n=1 Tax=Candidatus Giovannonibacteria bacterium RIFCSPLOWO2_01_FULL_45_34 TaxID=1798351 RepID=A0A1F5WY30_9BACT|nr:MAG: hypothetical protein A2662_00880 [Candidatus Giovannonibacteria bacterium RIFCSPHIGHO2_01_FULL_45_33]OGF70867.1 MAG: hypothetical protein A3C73_02210 [Candidatus Giovannonibacteria bacterium RIFCSPHIGHO2_02_FULL_44_11]OGF80530.1 MAG: hypothetical protein A2930_02775 [Candidatus Giovannonibacteria bacterium RIFCSPLOWO2_01_FULL_45_34]